MPEHTWPLEKAESQASRNAVSFHSTGTGKTVETGRKVSRDDHSDRLAGLEVKKVRMWGLPSGPVVKNLPS